jgi:hypothetical protein
VTLILLAGFGFRHPHRQHTTGQRCLDAVLPKITRQRDAILELPDPTGTAAQQALALALLQFPGHYQFVAVQLDVDIFALTPGSSIPTM